MDYKKFLANATDGPVYDYYVDNRRFESALALLFYLENQGFSDEEAKVFISSLPVQN